VILLERSGKADALYTIRMHRSKIPVILAGPS
jgi:hypothetical protein